MAVFLAGILLLSGLVYVRGGGGQSSSKNGVLGGPLEVFASADYGQNVIVAGSEDVITMQDMSGGSFSVSEPSDAGQYTLIASIGDYGQIAGLVSSRSNLLTYKVQKGDTLSGIASYFGVSLDTLVNANPSVRTKYLQPGDELNVLPISGIVYTTKDGDTLESISSYFNVPQKQIIQFNSAINFGTLGAGISLIIPGAHGATTAVSGSSLPNYNSRFIKPADGFNWGQLHHYNAVDIANTCGTPIRASAEGLILPDDSFGDGKNGWNGGYGKFVLIEHPFGDSVRTRYAHLNQVLVDIGDYVKQGDEIGTMGQTGDATGCHIHFEVYGARNPFAK